MSQDYCGIPLARALPVILQACPIPLVRLREFNYYIGEGVVFDAREQYWFEGIEYYTGIAIDLKNAKCYYSLGVQFEGDDRLLLYYLTEILQDIPIAIEPITNPRTGTIVRHRVKCSCGKEFIGILSELYSHYASRHVPEASDVPLKYVASCIEVVYRYLSRVKPILESI